MNSSNGSGSGYGVAPARERDSRAAQQHNILAGVAVAPRQVGYGMPCAHCKTYYTADLSACPVCKSPQRVSPVEPLAQV
ncbi:MAG: hypothetical protein DMG93_18465, partial [Acidobacteria bacterium]